MDKDLNVFLSIKKNLRYIPQDLEINHFTKSYYIKKIHNILFSYNFTLCRTAGNQ